MTPRHTIDTGLFKSTPKRRINEDNMNKVILWLFFIIAAACAWEDDYDEFSKDVKFNNKHCGEHGNECTGGTSCIDGHCACLNSHDCNGGCVDINCDINHCGACDVKCSPNQICINGVCTCPNNNNACGAACTACQAGQYCDGTGTCICQGSSTACGTGESCSTCAPPQQCINNICSCLYLNNFNPCTSGFNGCRPGPGGESFCCPLDGIPPGECSPRIGTIGINPNCCINCDNSANGNVATGHSAPATLIRTVALLRYVVPLTNHMLANAAFLAVATIHCALPNKMLMDVAATYAMAMSAHESHS